MVNCHPFEAEARLKTWNFSPFLKENTTLFYLKDKFVNAVQENSIYFWNHMKHMNRKRRATESQSTSSLYTTDTTVLWRIN
jgi:hypothetical protein